MIKYTHAGGMEDILYSLYFCKQLSRNINERRIEYYIQTNVKDPFTGKIIITKQEAQSLRPLLESQTFISKLFISDNKPKDAVDLNRYRSGIINTRGGDFRDYYYTFNNAVLPRHYERKAIRPQWDPDETYKDKVLINISQNKNNVNLNYKLLEQFKDKLVFVGTKREYNIFCQKYFTIKDFISSEENLLQIAKYFSGSKGLVSNQSTLFAIAELMKIPRILLTNDYYKDGDKLDFGIKNITPINGWTVVASINEKMIASVGELINLTYIEKKEEKEED